MNNSPDNTVRELYCLRYSKIPQVWYILNETFCIEIISKKYDSFIYPALRKLKINNTTARII